MYRMFLFETKMKNISLLNDIQIQNKIFYDSKNLKNKRNTPNI